MSYEWIRRRRRNLSFWYLFPEVVAPWIQFKRCLLRIMWFFTHPLDEFFEDLGELIAWPFVATAKFFSWILNGIGEFFKDLFDGIKSFFRYFRYLGRLPVWTGAAVAGTLGIIMTILLFFVQLATFDPVPLSAGMAIGEPTLAPVPEQQPDSVPQPVRQHGFDPFDREPTPQEQQMWRPETSTLSSGLLVQVDRLTLPSGWNSQQHIDVVSTTAPVHPEPWTQYERMSAMSSWSLTRIEQARQMLNFTPYVSRRNVRNSQVSPSWVATADSVNSSLPVENRREPSVSISRTAPASATLGAAMQYELLVSNTGAEPLDSVTVHEAISAIDRVMDVDPPASLVDDTLVWNVTNLQPREHRRISIELRPDRLVPIAAGSTVRVQTGVAAVSQVIEPTPLAPAITPEPPQEFNVFVPGPQSEPEPLPEPLPGEDIGMILPAFDDDPAALSGPPPEQTEPAFSFEQMPQRAPMPEPAIMPLIPVEHEEPAVVEHRPEQSSRTTERAGGVPIFFEMRTPRVARVDRKVATTFVIRNPGPADLTDLVILVEMTGELDHHKGRILEHRIERLVSGAMYQTRLTTTAIQGGRARVRSTLTSAEELESTLEAEIEVGRPIDPPTELSAAELPLQGLPMFTQ